MVSTGGASSDSSEGSKYEKLDFSLDVNSL